MYKSSKAGKKSGASGGAGLVPGARSFFADGEETSYVSEDMQVGFGGRPRWGLGWGMGVVLRAWEYSFVGRYKPDIEL